MNEQPKNLPEAEALARKKQLTAEDIKFIGNREIPVGHEVFEYTGDTGEKVDG